ncbi:MAG: DUF4198 domain-containing protein [Marinospirillum sp.]|uniref:DUF4198 domain-containing protein n=1 Tax=Marinospirillum sp. TaxID=2183934 RepID=UPI0019E19162|nr:DUF4198 domain-containing protein [Marinospirillum sp.]MBE0507187.1 DUF4198 domain-containing protein [Marinospirillum sp.]
MKKHNWLVATVLSAALLAPTVQAHPIWMLPSEFNLSTEEAFWITVDATAAHGVFSFDKPVGLDNVSIYGPEGDRRRIGPYYKGQRRSVFDLQLDNPGTYKVEMRGQPRYMTSYVVGERNTARRAFGSKLEVQLPEGARDVRTTAVQTISGFYVTHRTPTTKVLETTGEGFELHALTHPSDVVKGEEARFKFTYDGKPAADMKVELVPHGTAWRDSRMQVDLTTDKEGILRFTPVVTGPHLLTTSLRMDIDSPLADGVGVNYLLTFEVLPQ